MREKDGSRTTMLVISMGFLVLYLLRSWRWAAYVSLAAGMTGIFSPYLSGKIERAWMGLGSLLGLVIPRILLAAVFYLVLFPVSLAARLARKDPLMLSKDRNSNFLKVDREPSKEDLEKLW